MLDLFFTDHPSQISNIKNFPGMSDHDIVMITADIKPEFIVQSSQKVFLYHKANWNANRQNLFALANLFPHLLTTNSDVKYLCTLFNNTLLDLMARYIPCKTTSKRWHLPWIKNHIRKLIKKRDTQYKLYKTSGSTQAHNNLKILKYRIQTEIRTSCWRYINNLIFSPDNDNQPPSCQKRFWSYIKNMTRPSRLV